MQAGDDLDDILDGSSSDDDTPVCEAVRVSDDSDDSLDDLLDGSASGEFPSSDLRNRKLSCACAGDDLDGLLADTPRNENGEEEAGSDLSDLDALLDDDSDAGSPDNRVHSKV